ncbi:MAG: hypothetical protein HY397_02480 [Candidatus Doudnabacteria bacterium]|nr:hypothetical protein [Candidatus Doudnabacteria bacterium]
MSIGSEECCSGHPQDQQDLDREGRVLFDDEATNPHAQGYLNLRYDASDPRSAQFHDAFRKIRAVSWGYEARHDSHGIRSEMAEQQDLRGNLNLEQIRGVNSTDSPPASLEWLKRQAKAAAEEQAGLVSVLYEIRTKARPELVKPGTTPPGQQAEVLARFWSEVGGVIQRYEAAPVPEKLEPWYFAVRSRYGKMELTHQSFAGYASEIEKRSASDG